MTAAFWLTTGQTVVFVVGTLFAYWVATRIAHLLDAADHVRAHTEAGAQRATRAALDARQMLDVLTEFWEQLRAEDQQQQEPQTEPMRRVGTDTVETARVTDDAMERILADARARWDALTTDRPAVTDAHAGAERRSDGLAVVQGPRTPEDTTTEPRRSRA